MKGLKITKDQIDNYLAFLHDFEKEVESKENHRGILQGLLKKHKVAGGTIPVMKSIGYIEGGNHKNIIIKYHTPAEPIIARRILAGLYEYNKTARVKRMKVEELAKLTGNTGKVRVANSEEQRKEDAQKLKNSVLGLEAERIAQDFIDKNAPDTPKESVKEVKRVARKNASSLETMKRLKVFGIELWKTYRSVTSFRLYILYVPIFKSNSKLKFNADEVE